MRNRILAIAAIVGAIAAPIAAQAQSTTRRASAAAARWSSVNTKVSFRERSAFREYIVRERVPNYTISERVIVGGCCRKSA